MLNKGINKKMACLILLVIIGQVLFGICEVKTRSEPAADKTSYFLSADRYHSESETAFINPGQQRNIEFLDLSVQLWEFLNEQGNVCSISKNNYYYRKKNPDSRKKIRIMIQPHFHGSKYKKEPVLMTACSK